MSVCVGVWWVCTVVGMTVSLCRLCVCGRVVGVYSGWYDLSLCRLCVCGRVVGVYSGWYDRLSMQTVCTMVR